MFFSHLVVLTKSTSEEHLLREKKKEKKTSDHSSPVKSLFEAFPLDVKLEDGPLAVSGGIVAPTMLLEESIKTIFWGVLLTAHEHHWDTMENQ